MPSAHANKTIPNPLATREPQLVEMLTAQRIRVYDALLDALATKVGRRAGIRTENHLHALDELTATAQILRMLTKAFWNANDLTVFEENWRQASGCALFAEEFESERFRIRYAVDAAAKELLSQPQANRDVRSHIAKSPASRVSQPSLFGAKVYRGHRTKHGVTVIVEEDGQHRDLDRRLDLRHHAANFDWGNSSGGSAQLALALAADVLQDDASAQADGQRLLCRLIAALPNGEWSLNEDRLHAALKATKQEPAQSL